MIRTDLAALFTVLIAGCGAADVERQAPEPRHISGGDTMRIQITVGSQTFHATLDDSAASQDLLSQLPQTIEMRDHGGVEKTGPLRSGLSLDGQPDGADPDVGDVGYYAPGNDFVLYYGDQSYYSGIVILGHLDGDAPARLAQMEGRVRVTIDRQA